jgi:uncharacterized protein YjeT (DUF2065 family)
MSSSSVSLICSLIVALAFAWAGLAKIGAPERWRKDLTAYRLARPFRGLGWLVLPWLELLVPVGAVAGHARLSAGFALVLLAAFSATILRARILGGSNQLACGCFGGHATRDYRLLLLRNGALAAPAAYVVAAGSPQGLLSPAPPHAWLLLGAVALVAGAWILWQLRSRLRRRVAARRPV